MVSGNGMFRLPGSIAPICVPFAQIHCASSAVEGNAHAKVIASVEGSHGPAERSVDVCGRRITNGFGKREKGTSANKAIHSRAFHGVFRETGRLGIARKRRGRSCSDARLIWPTLSSN